MLECFFLNPLTFLDELHGLHALELIPEVVADRSLEHFVHEIEHCANHGNHARSFLVGNVDLDLQVDLENEPLTALGNYLLQIPVQVVGSRDRFRLV